MQRMLENLYSEKKYARKKGFCFSENKTLLKLLLENPYPDFLKYLATLSWEHFHLIHFNLIEYRCS